MLFTGRSIVLQTARLFAHQVASYRNGNVPVQCTMKRVGNNTFVASPIYGELVRRRFFFKLLAQKDSGIVTRVYKAGRELSLVYPRTRSMKDEEGYLALSSFHLVQVTWYGSLLIYFVSIDEESGEIRVIKRHEGNSDFDRSELPPDSIMCTEYVKIGPEIVSIYMAMSYGGVLELPTWSKVRPKI